MTSIQVLCFSKKISRKFSYRYSNFLEIQIGSIRVLYYKKISEYFLYTYRVFFIIIHIVFVAYIGTFINLYGNEQQIFVGFLVNFLIDIGVILE